MFLYINFVFFYGGIFYGEKTLVIELSILLFVLQLECVHKTVMHCIYTRKSIHTRYIRYGVKQFGIIRCIQIKIEKMGTVKLVLNRKGFNEGVNETVNGYLF